MISDDDVTEQFGAIASRFPGNMQEHSVVFVSTLWMYTLFADSATGAALGALYLVARLTYPLFYMANHGFDLWFEMCTQTGYGVIGARIPYARCSCAMHTCARAPMRVQASTCWDRCIQPSAAIGWLSLPPTP